MYVIEIRKEIIRIEREKYDKELDKKQKKLIAIIQNFSMIMKIDFFVYIYVNPYTVYFFQLYH